MTMTIEKVEKEKEQAPHDPYQRMLHLSECAMLRYLWSSGEVFFISRRFYLRLSLVSSFPPHFLRPLASFSASSYP